MPELFIFELQLMRSSLLHLCTTKQVSSTFFPKFVNKQFFSLGHIRLGAFLSFSISENDLLFLFHFAVEEENCFHDV